MGGFTACGKYYEMGEPQEYYIEYCKRLLNDIKANARKDNSKVISLNYHKDKNKKDYTSLVLKNTKSF